MSADKITALRAAKHAAEEAKFAAFAALRARERAIAAPFADPYGRDNYTYERAKASDAETGRLLAAFNAARAAFHVAARNFREAAKRCPVCQDGDCETKSEACGK